MSGSSPRSTGVHRRYSTAARRAVGDGWVHAVELIARARRVTVPAARGTRIVVRLGPVVARFRFRWTARPGATVRVSAAVGADGLADRDLLDLSVAGYGGRPPPGWRDLGDDEMLALGLCGADLHGPSGMDARIMTDDAGHHVISYAGTSAWVTGNALTPDAVSGLRGLVVPDDQTRDAVDLAVRVRTAIGPGRLTLCGHSLGGRNAAAASVVTGARAVTFNAAGVSDADLMYALRMRVRRAGLRVHVSGWLTDPFAAQRRTQWRDQIRNYVAGADLVTYGQDGLGLRDALGTRIHVPGSRNPLVAHRLDQFIGKVP